MGLHHWQTSVFEPIGNYYGMTTCIQNYQCEHCQKTLRIPAIGVTPENEGCTGTVQRKKVIRTSPFEGRDDDRDEVKRTKDYQQKEKGKREKKNTKRPVQW